MGFYCLANLRQETFVAKESGRKCRGKYRIFCIFVPVLPLQEGRFGMGGTVCAGPIAWGDEA